MSRLTRVLVLGAMLGAMSLSMTTIAQQAATGGDAVQRFRQGERDSLAQPSVPLPAAEPTGQSNWFVPALGVLVAVLALGGGLVAMARRTAARSDLAKRSEPPHQPS